tara:strand:+ start:10528 stop:11133 length:606 start_codon:yes stop_codon:yes gene_type:complete
MGLFGFLFGGNKSNVEFLPDRIWLTEKAKESGIRAEIEKEAASQPAGILLVTHFPDTLKYLSELQTAIDADFDLRLASELTSDLTSLLTFDDRQYVILVAERHPLRSHDDRIVEFAEDLPCKCRMAFHLSLEDPLIKVFIGPTIEPLLRTLGMEESEAIESNMVSRRIAAAQKKIGASVFGDTEADNAHEWLKSNMPDFDA